MPQASAFFFDFRILPDFRGESPVYAASPFRYASTRALSRK